MHCVIAAECLCLMLSLPVSMKGGKHLSILCYFSFRVQTLVANQVPFENVFVFNILTARQT